MGFSAAALAVSIAGLGYGVYSGEQQAAQAKKGLKRQDKAQKEAQGNALRQDRLNQEEEAKAKAKPPDVDTLLGTNKPKPGSLGISPSQLLLGNRYLGF